MKSTWIKPADLQIKFAELWRHRLPDVIRIDDLQLLTLRYHALLEAGLRELLAVRLDISPPKLPDLTFEKVARLALGGMRHELLDAALGINRIRNYVAHNVDVRELETKVRDLIATNAILGTDWPPTTLTKCERWGTYSMWF